MTSNETVQDMLPLTPAVFHILLSLVHEDRHGYGIMQEVLARTDGQIKLGPGTLYGAVKRLLATGLIEEVTTQADTDLDDARRRYYHLTPLGFRVAQAEAQRLEQLLNQSEVRRLLLDTGGA